MKLKKLRLVIDIRLDTEGFEDDPAAECARLLTKLALDIRAPSFAFSPNSAPPRLAPKILGADLTTPGLLSALYDNMGNCVGSCDVIEDQSIGAILRRIAGDLNQ